KVRAHGRSCEPRPEWSTGVHRRGSGRDGAPTLGRGTREGPIGARTRGQVDRSGRRLERGAAPSLPDGFINSIIGRPVNVDSGPCAMAAYLNEQVIAADLTSETRWGPYAWCPMALAHGLQACWSTPISSTAGKVLGAFAIYYDQPRTPTTCEQRLIEQFTHIASIAVERAQNHAALKRSEAFLAE